MMPPLKNIRQSLALLITGLICLFSYANAQGPLQWIQQFDRPTAIGSAQFVASADVAYTSSGCAIVAGAVKENTGTTLTGTSDAGLVKYSPAGIVLNSFFYDYNSSGGTDKTVRVIVTGDFVYALIKGQFNVTPSFDYDFYIVKFDTNLVSMGSVYFNGTGNVNDVPTDMGIDAAGNIYVIGTTQRPATGQDGILIKYNATLTQQYVKYFSSTGIADDAFTALKVEPSGACDITGYSTTAATGQKLLAIKYWGNGVLLWTKYYDANSATTNIDQGRAITYDPVTGDVYVTGLGYYTANSGWVVVKFSGIDGTRLWEKRYEGLNNNNDEGVDISWFSNSALYVCGKFKSTVSGITAVSSHLKKLNPADGSAIWAKVYIGPAASGPTTPAGAFLSSMLVTPSENIYLLGSTNRQTPTYTEANHLVLKYNSSGTLSWSDLQSAASTSGFQSYTAVKAAYIPSSQVLYVAGTKNVTMSFVGTWSIAKYGPTAIAQPIDENSSYKSGRFSTNLDMRVYPNPVKDILNIEASGDLNVADIIVLDMMGQVVFRSNDQQLPLQINTSQFAKGIYQVIINTQKRNIVSRVVKE